MHVKKSQFFRQMDQSRLRSSNGAASSKMSYRYVMTNELSTLALGLIKLIHVNGIQVTYDLNPFSPCNILSQN
jgi:hypothetical protein